MHTDQTTCDTARLYHLVIRLTQLYHPVCPKVKDNSGRSSKDVVLAISTVVVTVLFTVVVTVLFTVTVTVTVADGECTDTGEDEAVVELCQCVGLVVVKFVLLATMVDKRLPVDTVLLTAALDDVFVRAVETTMVVPLTGAVVTVVAVVAKLPIPLVVVVLFMPGMVVTVSVTIVLMVMKTNVVVLFAGLLVLLVAVLLFVVAVQVGMIGIGVMISVGVLME